jgi:hypothetical protein
MKTKITIVILLITALILVFVLQVKSSKTFKEEIISSNTAVQSEQECENYTDIQTFATPTKVSWEATLDGCLVSCEGGVFTKDNISKEDKFPRFVGYMKEAKTIDEKYFGQKVKVTGTWTSIEADHAKTVFDNKCVPIVNNIEITNL